MHLFDFRFNAREVTDGERMVAAIGKTKGKRITLKALKGEKMPATPEGMTGTDSAV